MLWLAPPPQAHISMRLLRRGAPRYSLSDEAGERAEGVGGTDATRRDRRGGGDTGCGPAPVDLPHERRRTPGAPPAVSSPFPSPLFPPYPPPPLPPPTAHHPPQHTH